MKILRLFAVAVLALISTTAFAQKSEIILLAHRGGCGEGMENTLGTVGIVDVDEAEQAAFFVAEGGVGVSVKSPKVVAVFDIMGRKVTEAYVEGSHVFSLPAGIYLVDGEKVLVK